MSTLSNVNPSVVSLTLLSVASGLLLYNIWKKQYHRSNYPPGPFSYPILGNIPQIVAAGSWDNFLNKYRRIYGNIFTIEVGGNKRVVVCGYENIYYLLVKNADYTSERTVVSFPPEISDIVKEAPGLVWAPAPHWKTLRNFSLNVLRDEGMGKQALEPTVMGEIERFCKHYIDSSLEQPIDLSRGLCKATSNIISEMIFGGRSEYDDPSFNAMLDSVNASIRLIVRAGITQNIPFAKYFKASGLAASREANYFMLPEMQKQLDLHKASLDPDNPRDIFDLYLLHQRKVNREDSCFKDGNASVMAAQLYSAGTDTTANSLRWALLFSCLHPEVKEKVQKEIDEQIGKDRCVSFKDRISMPYVDAVLQETLRHGNIVAFALPHTLSKELTVDGQVIPAGADLAIAISQVLRDPDTFEKPNEFYPEHYLTGDVATKKQRTIAFSIGRRACLGESLARMEFFMIYVTLLQRYDVRLADDSVGITEEPASLALNEPQPYRLVFSRR